jgi:hypothetical protein
MTLQKEFSKNPYRFLSESDIRSRVYELLNRHKAFSETRTIKSDSCWAPTKILRFKPVKTSRLHSEFLTPGERFDLVILEPDDMTVRRNSKGRIGYITIKESRKFQALIEVKSSRTNRSTRSKSNFTKEIKKDLSKIKRYGPKLAYMLIFDFNNYLTERDLNNLRKINRKAKLILFSVKSDYIAC